LARSTGANGNPSNQNSGQPVGFKLIDPKQAVIKLFNYHHFKNLNELQGTWSLLLDGTEIENGDFIMELPALEDREMTIPVELVNYQGELILIVGFSLKRRFKLGSQRT